MSAEQLQLQIQTKKNSNGFFLEIKAQIPLSGVSAIVGPSGAGKTTLLRIIAGLDAQSHGSVRYAGKLWQDTHRGVWVKPEYRAIAMVFEQASLFPHLTVLDNLKYAVKRSHGKSHFSLHEISTRLGMEHLLKRSVLNLSAGERQRVAIARALLNGAKLILMDEPLSALDPAAANQLANLVRKLPSQYNISLILVSHNWPLVAQIADHVTLLEKGKIAQSGDWQRLTSSWHFHQCQFSQTVNILSATPLKNKEEKEKSFALVDGQKLRIPNQSTFQKSQLRLSIEATKIVIVTDLKQNTSLINSLKVTITKIESLDTIQALVQLQLQHQFLYVVMLNESLIQLKLSLGQRVLACFSVPTVACN